MRVVSAAFLCVAIAITIGCSGSRSPVAPSAAGQPVDAVPSNPAPPPALPQSLYVSPGGSNGADGRTPQTAVRTLAHALALVTPGETVRVLPGTYVESVRTELRGRPGRPIRIVGESGRPVLSGDRRRAVGLWLEESAYVEIEGIEVRDYTDIGIAIVLSNNIEMRDLVLHDNGFRATIPWVGTEGYGVHLDESSQLVFERSEVYRNGPNPRTPTTVGTGINGFAIRDSVIRNNRSYDNYGGGILVEDSVRVLVESNDIFSNDLDVSADEWWDGGIWVDGGRDITVRNNVFSGNLGPGIEISDEDLQQPTGYVLENNRSTGNYFGIYIWNFGSTDLPPEHVLRLVGNDFSGNLRRDIWIQAWPCPRGCS